MSSFYITLEYAIRKSAYKQEAPYSTSQSHLWTMLMTVIIGRSSASMKEALQLLEDASEEVGLVVNEGKTKYMVAANTQNCYKPRTIETGRYNFERVDSFTYLGSLVTDDSNVSEEITNCLIATNRS